MNETVKQGVKQGVSKYSDDSHQAPGWDTLLPAVPTVTDEATTVTDEATTVADAADVSHRAQGAAQPEPGVGRVLGATAVERGGGPGRPLAGRTARASPALHHLQARLAVPAGAPFPRATSLLPPGEPQYAAAPCSAPAAAKATAPSLKAVPIMHLCLSGPLSWLRPHTGCQPARCGFLDG